MHVFTVRLKLNLHVIYSTCTTKTIYSLMVYFTALSVAWLIQQKVVVVVFNHPGIGGF
jgi:hypothetical protein